MLEQKRKLLNFFSAIGTGHLPTNGLNLHFARVGRVVFDVSPCLRHLEQLLDDGQFPITGGLRQAVLFVSALDVTTDLTGGYRRDRLVPKFTKDAVERALRPGLRSLSPFVGGEKFVRNCLEGGHPLFAGDGCADPLPLGAALDHVADLSGHVLGTLDVGHS